MKNALLISYILFVMFVSGTTRADEVTSLPIQEVNYKEDSFILRAMGPITNSCVGSPLPQIRPGDQVNDVVLHMISPHKSGVCMQVVRGIYDVSFDIRQTLAASGLKIDRNQSYRIRVPKLGFEIIIHGRDINPSVDSSTVKVSGMLMRSPNGQYAILTDEQRLMIVENKDIDFQPYTNRKVLIAARVLFSAQPMTLAGTAARTISLAAGPSTHVQPSERIVVVAVAAINKNL